MATGIVEFPFLDVGGVKARLWHTVLIRVSFV
jgi:hypothetical protein